MKRRQGKWKRLTALMLSVLLCAVCVISSSAAVARERVRVGFFAFDGYHMEDETGLKSGYGYDFIQMARRYNNWNVEFVGYDKSWSEMQQMLEDGQIDLLTSAQKTPEREEKFDYSENSIGTSNTMLTVRGDDERYAVGDVASYQGMRVGLLNGNSRNDSFAAYAADKDFSYTPVYYEDTSTMLSALQNGTEIDAVVTSSLRCIDNEKILEEFDASDFYAIVKKGNTALLDEVNAAIRQMDINSSGWRTELKNKYYSPESGSAISFTAQELEYLRQSKEEGTVLRVLFNPDLSPYSYYDKNGEPAGIAPKIFDELASRVDLAYQYIKTDTYQSYRTCVQDGNYDVDLTCFFNYSMAEQYNMDLTDAYMSTSLAQLVPDGSNGTMQKVAIIRDSEGITSYSAALLEKTELVEYDTMKECVNAVLHGQADGMYLYAYSAQQEVAENAQNRLRMMQMPEYTVELAIGVNQDNDYRLLTIINKGVKSVHSNYTQQVVQEITGVVAQNHSLIALFYDQPGLVLTMTIVLLSALFVLTIGLLKSHSVHQVELQAQELARFMSYVCESNEMVLEVNLDTMVCQRHCMEHGALVSVQEPYRFTHHENLEDMIKPEDYQHLCDELSEQKLLAMIEQGTGTYFEIRTKDAEGVYRWYSYTLRGIPRDQKHPKNFILFKKNVDAVKQEEQQQRQVLEDALETARYASAAKGQFLSRMSHEIRTPLNAVIGYMDIAKDSSDNPQKVMHCVENSELAARHLLNIINDVLDISSIESGKMKIAHEDFDLRKLITTVSTVFFNQAKGRQVNFEVEIHELTEEWVTGDSLRVNQVLMNLLSNAVKFTPEQGKVTLTVTQVSKTPKKVYLRFLVQDTGIGMSEEYQKKLFTPFEQESAATAKKYGGTGLGLSITNNLVTMMGGSIEVHSKQGIGTTFIVALHFDLPKEAHQTAVLSQDYARVRALVVDDEQSSCDYIKTLLKRCGVKSDFVLDGKSAIRQVRRRMGTDYAYDLCILDWNMPGMNGLETARQLREICGSKLPIIIATAYDVTDLEDEAKAVGVDRVIAKPLFQSTMFDLLVSTYGKYQPAEPMQKPQLDLTGKRVLLAEDNEMNMEIAVDVLTKAGLQVDGVGDGQQAVERFTAAEPGTYQVILMDVQMPVLDGYQATERIRMSAHPEAKKIPIIAMTANAFAEDVTAALSSGMNDHISKPIDYDKLFQVLSKFMKDKG